jgi:hypothetical protein
MQTIRRPTVSVRGAERDYQLRARNVARQIPPIANSAVSAAPTC